MLVVVELIVSFFIFIWPAIEVLVSIICLPQIIVQLLLKNVDFYYQRNLITSYFFFILSVIYLMIILNIHVLIFFTYYYESGAFTQFVVLVFSNTLSVIFNTMFIRNNLNFYYSAPDALYSIGECLFFTIIFIFFILSFGDYRCFNILYYGLVRTNLSLLAILFEFLCSTILNIMLNLMITLHLSNPISFFRIVCFGLTSYSFRSTEGIIPSTILILQDFILYPLIIINLILSPLKSFKRFFQVVNLIGSSHTTSKLVENKSINKFDKNFITLTTYINFKYYFILDLFYDNMKFYVGIILLISNILVFWKLPKAVSIIKQYYYTHKDFTQMALELIINLFEGISEILYYLVNFYFKINSIYRDFAKLVSSRNIFSELDKFDKTYWILVLKQKDIICSIITFPRIFLSNYILFFIFNKKKKLNNEFYQIFPLLGTDSSLLNNMSLDITKPNYKDNLSDEFGNRRKKLLEITLLDIVESALFFLLLLSGFFNPYTFLVVIFCIKNKIKLLFKCVSFEQALLEFKSLKEIELELIKQIFVIAFVKFPAHIIVTIISPWNLYPQIYFTLEIINNWAYKNISSQTKSPNEIKEELNIMNSSVNNQTLELFTRFIEGWKFIFKCLVVHLTFFRIYFLYYDFVTTLRFKHNPNSNSKPKSKNNNLFFSLNSSNTLLSITSNNYFKLYSYFIHKHSTMVGMEIPGYLIFLVFLFTCPWNLLAIIPFLKAKTYYEKYSYLMPICYKVVFDYFIIMGIIINLLSIFQTAQTVKLLYFFLKQYFSHSETAKEQFNIYYQSTFKQEIVKLTKNLYKKLFSLILIVFNILLILRVVSLFRRLYPFIKRSLISNVMKLQSYFPHEKKQTQSLQKLRGNEMTSISKYLTPKEILYLGLTCKSLYNKMNYNLVWEFQLNNFFIPRLNASGTTEKTIFVSKKKLSCDRNMEKKLSGLIQGADENFIGFDLTKNETFSHHKLLCEKLAEVLSVNHQTLSESDRDTFIGYFSVILEETVESIVKLPHLLLIPIKIFSCFLILLNQVVIKLASFLSKFLEFFNNNICKLTISKFPDDREVMEFDYNELKLNFYDVQVAGLLSFLNMIIRILQFIIISLINNAIILLQFASFANPNSKRPNSISVLIQFFYGVNLAVILWVIIFFPENLFSYTEKIQTFYSTLFYSFTDLESLFALKDYVYTNVVDLIDMLNKRSLFSLFFGIFSFYKNIIAYFVVWGIIEALKECFRMNVENIIIFKFTREHIRPNLLYKIIFRIYFFHYNYFIYDIHLYLPSFINNVVALICLIGPLIVTYKMSIGWFLFILYNSINISYFVNLNSLSNRSIMRRDLYED